MPHDMNGMELKVSDAVLIPCKIKAIHLTEEYCNVDLETNSAMYPANNRTSMTLNSRQLLKRGDEENLLRAARVFLDWLVRNNHKDAPRIDAFRHNQLIELISKIDEELS